MVSSLAGKIAIVTGGAQGLGEHSARKLAEHGATVVITDVQKASGTKLAKELGGSSTFVEHDVSDETAWRVVLDLVSDRFGKVDILVNNAGLMEFAPLGDMELALFDRVIAVNVRGNFLGCKLILPLMRAAGGGAIVNVSSISGMIANMPGGGAYATSKGAIRMLTKAAAIDYAPFNIRVNSVHPGAMRTPRSASVLDDPEQHDAAIGRVPMGRAAEAAEVAKVVAFLASDEASYMTGAEVVADGGYLAC